MTIVADQSFADAESEESLSSIAKAARVLRALAAAGDGDAGVTELAGRALLPKSTTHRVLSELIGAGLVGRSGQRYRLGPGWFELQSALSSSEWLQLVDQAKRPLAALFERTGATVHFGVLDGEKVMYLEKLTAKGGTSVSTRVGAHKPVTCTALGKALLAFADPDLVRSVLAKPLPIASRTSIGVPALLARQLAAIRKAGLAYDVEESQPGVHCVAAPVFRNGAAVAAVSVTRVGSRVLPPTDEENVRRAARQIADWLPIGPA